MTTRTYDLELIQPTVSRTYKVPMDLTMTRENKHRRVTGIQKLAQRYLVLFMTITDSIAFAKGIGADFLKEVVQGKLRTRAYIVQYFNLSNSSVTQQLTAENTGVDHPEVPDDELLASATLVDYNIDYVRGVLYLKVKLTSRAGSNYEFIIPTE